MIWDQARHQPGRLLRGLLGSTSFISRFTGRFQPRLPSASHVDSVNDVDMLRHRDILILDTATRINTLTVSLGMNRDE